MTYEDTENFWDEIFGKCPVGSKADEELPYDWMESALEWLVEMDTKIIDFGCGSGRALLRTTAYGSSFVMGIDISEKAIEVCEKNASGLSQDYRFTKGGLEVLRDIPDSDFHGGILFNVLDNLLPDDADELLEQFKRILKPGGRLLVKLNDHVKTEEMLDMGAEDIGNGSFRESSGLYLWNLTDEEAKLKLGEYFEIVDEKRVYYPEHEMYNRLYYMRK